MLVAGCAGDERGHATIDAVSELRSPGSAGSRYPHLAVGPDGTVVMSWLQPLGGLDHELRFATLTPAGWSSARSAAAGEDWFVNWADFPSVVPGADGLLAAHWLQRRPGHAFAYDVQVAVSSDSGVNWSAPVTLHDDDTPTEHGFVTLLAMPASVLAVWLDGRRTQPAAGHDHGGTGAMTLRSATLDREGSITGIGSEIDARVCDCCQTDATVSAAGPLVVYRDRSAAEIRDIAIVRLEATGWTKPMPVHADGWHVTGCPVNGPAIDARGDAVAVAWYTAPDRPRVRLAFSDDSGRSFTPPVEVDADKVAGRVDVVMLDDGRAVVSWMTQSDEGAEFVARPFRRDGPAGDRILVARLDGGRPTGFPRMVRAGDQLVFAWTESTDPTALRTAVARLR